MGVIVGGLVTYIAAKEDPQGEFDDDEGLLSDVSPPGAVSGIRYGSARNCWRACTTAITSIVSA